ncbi:hypothetical protein K438DRAFT_1967377 [Mycena galopus ATCC 62051]|nr:hypothetical protein K438DRAFT_1967377 [Mycena galopus ATCC 62051]
MNVTDSSSPLPRLRCFRSRPPPHITPHSLPPKPTLLASYDPFAPFFPSLHPLSQQLYVKGLHDPTLFAWIILPFSLLLQPLSLSPSCPPLDFQAPEPGAVCGAEYHVLYFSVVGVWGIHNMPYSRTGWFDTRAFWSAYPPTYPPGPLKAYHFAQIAYWFQQAPVWSYVMNVTLPGNAVFVGMGGLNVISPKLNYLRLERPKVVSFAAFVVGWRNQTFDRFAGLYMAPWVRDQMFGALCVLQALNFFWF